MASIHDTQMLPIPGAWDPPQPSWLEMLEEWTLRELLDQPNPSRERDDCRRVLALVLCLKAERREASRLRRAEGVTVEQDWRAR